jgi:ribonuclease HII
MMRELDTQYPGYGLAEHKGYPTASHVQAIRERGVLPIHRRSFGPVRECLGLAAPGPVQGELFAGNEPTAGNEPAAGNELTAGNEPT